MSSPLWSILIASVDARRDLLDPLIRKLDLQCAPHRGRVTVLVDRDDGTEPIGRKRTRLLEAASSDYVCFVDDDDHVHPEYVNRILAALAGRPDYVGFRVRYTVDGAEQKQVVHSLELGGWSETPDAYLRDISHLNPIRREIALAGLPFDPGFGEDRSWADRVRATGLARRQVFIDRVLYHYDWRSDVSLFAGGRA